jgi:fructokinase
VILVCGEALIDLFTGAATASGIPAEAVAGGSPFNVAIGLGRLGRETGFLSCLSEDAFGEFLASRLSQAGVSAEFIERRPNRTTLSVVATSASGQPQYSFYSEDGADRALTRDDLPAQLPAAVKAIAAGSYSLGVEPVASAIEALLQREKTQRVISLDPNVRPRVVGDLARYRERFERLITHAAIVKASDEDVELLYGTRDLVAVARGWMERGPQLVIVTRGADGPLATFGASVVERSVPSVDVVDTVGAGDTFHAGLLAWLDAHALLNLESIAQLKEAQIIEVLDFAAASAAIVCTRRGANPPAWDEVVRFLADRA